MFLIVDDVLGVEIDVVWILFVLIYIYIEFGYKKKKIKLWYDCVKNIFELELINVVLEKYVNCFIYGDILYVIFKY